MGGGYKDVVAKLGRGVYDTLLEEEFDIVASTVKRQVEKVPMVVFSLPNCPQCDVLFNYLEQRGVPAASVFVKWDKASEEYPALKAQIMQLIGRSSFSFPQTFISSEYQGNFD